jgi:hypothetical protein
VLVVARSRNYVVGNSKRYLAWYTVLKVQKVPGGLQQETTGAGIIK